MRIKTVVVAGLGYVGLPLAMRAAEAGYRVIGYDVDADRVKLLAAGESYIEDVPASQLAGALESGAFRASCEPRACAGFDVAVVTVPTPLRDGPPDLGDVEAGGRRRAGGPRGGAAAGGR